MNKSWLCANLGVAFIVCTLILYLFFILTYVILGMGLYSMLLLYPFGILSFLAVTPECAPPGKVSNLEPVIGFILFAILFFYFTLNPEMHEAFTRKQMRVCNITFLISYACSAILAFFVARFAHENFYETVSRRWLYTNSNVEKFDAKWKYTINRFIVARNAVFFFLMEIASAIFLAILHYQGEI